MSEERTAMDDEEVLSPAYRWLDKTLIWVSLILGGFTLAFMTAFSTWNVLIMRKALNAPIIGAEDILILLLVVIVALSIPLGARTGAHIEIEVLEPRMSPGFAKWSMIFVKLLCVIVLVLMAWRLWHAGESASRFGETTQQLLISYEPFYYLLAVSVSIYAFVVILDIHRIWTGKKTVRMKLEGDVM